MAAIEKAMAALETGDAAADLIALRTLVPGGDAFVGDGHTVVIGSLAGGAGSGVILEVVESVRNATTDFDGKKDPQTVLIASDVFKGIGPDRGIYPNALATLAELLNGAEATGILPSAEVELRAGALGDVAGPRVGRTNFVVGSSNGAVTFSSPKQAYEAVGRLLCAVALNPRHQQQFDQYIDVNAPLTPVARGLGEFAYCAGVGYSVLGLGRHLFQQYGAERLARGMFDRLVKGHEERETHLPVDVRLRKTIETRWNGGYPAAAGLSTMGPGPNQVMDALRDRAQVTSELQMLKDKFLTKIGDRKNRFTGPDWEAVHESEFRMLALKAEENATNERHRRAKIWTDTIQDHLVAATVQELSAYGLPVALGLLKKLDEDLENGEAALRKAVKDNQDKEKRHSSQARTILTDLIGEVRGDAEAHDTSAQYRTSGMVWKFEADTAALAAELVADIRLNLVPFLQRALDGLLGHLRSAALHDPTKTSLDRWSTSAVPLHLLPAGNELLLEPVSGFPTVLEELLMQQFLDTKANDAVKRSCEEAITGDWPAHAGAAHTQTLVDTQTSWEPTVGAARWSDVPASSAEFRIDITLDGFPARASAWLAERYGPMGDYLAQTLAGFLTDQATAAEHAATFLAKLELALARSLPFLSVDTDISVELHGDPGEDTYTSVSTIPIAIAPGSGLYDAVVQTLAAGGVDPTTVTFDPTSSAAEVDFIRYPTIKFHPAALNSVTGPIGMDWGNRQAREGSSKEFWEFRRSRSLEAFIPLPRELQLRLVGGFYVAAALGYLDLPHEELWSARPRFVWSEDALLPLPRRLLAAQGKEPREAREVLPALLESFPLTWLGINSSTSVLHAYERLMDLGAVNNGQCHHEIGHWIAEGEPIEGMPVFPAKPAIHAPDPIKRRKTLADHLEWIVTTLEDRAAKPLKATMHPRDVDGLREVTGLVAEALTSIKDALPPAGKPSAGTII
jgi:hypothetical protein